MKTTLIILIIVTIIIVIVVAVLLSHFITYIDTTLNEEDKCSTSQSNDEFDYGHNSNCNLSEICANCECITPKACAVCPYNKH